MKPLTTTDKDLFLLGLMFARGNFVGEREKVIAIYFRTTEIDLIDRIKKENTEYTSQKLININQDKKIVGLYFPSSVGNKMKDLFYISKQEIRSRLIPAKIKNQEFLPISFIRGLLTAGLSVEKKGMLFWTKRTIEFKEQSIDIINKISLLLLKHNIKYEIKDNSKLFQYLDGKKITMSSIIKIEEKYFTDFYKLIQPINPELDFLKTSS